MTSEVEERPRLMTAGYSRHRGQWVNILYIDSNFFFFFFTVIIPTCTFQMLIKEQLFGSAIVIYVKITLNLDQSWGYYSHPVNTLSQIFMAVWRLLMSVG